MRVIVESPFAGATPKETYKNVLYARDAIRDCLNRGESPYASHLFYTQKGVLDDTVPEQRKQGIDAALEWLKVADFVAVYIDNGITRGMLKGIVRAVKLDKEIRLRWLYEKREEEVIE